jgi:hypothetical protein
MVALRVTAINDSLHRLSKSRTKRFMISSIAKSFSICRPGILLFLITRLQSKKHSKPKQRKFRTLKRRKKNEKDERQIHLNQHQKAIFECRNGDRARLRRKFKESRFVSRLMYAEIPVTIHSCHLTRLTTRLNEWRTSYKRSFNMASWRYLSHKPTSAGIRIPSARPLSSRSWVNTPLNSFQRLYILL